VLGGKSYLVAILSFMKKVLFLGLNFKVLHVKRSREERKLHYNQILNRKEELRLYEAEGGEENAQKANLYATATSFCYLIFIKLIAG